MREAEARGVGPERLVVAPELSAASISPALYTLPFNANTTATDALWAGLPFADLRR
jgi:predicted O-linked N-acetylglucosamine transferase (SPINDLY family)